MLFRLHLHEAALTHTPNFIHFYDFGIAESSALAQSGSAPLPLLTCLTPNLYYFYSFSLTLVPTRLFLDMPA